MLSGSWCEALGGSGAGFEKRNTGEETGFVAGAEEGAIHESTFGHVALRCF